MECGSDISGHILLSFIVKRPNAHHTLETKKVQGSVFCFVISSSGDDLISINLKMLFSDAC